MLGEGQNCYYHIATPDALASIRAAAQYTDGGRVLEHLDTPEEISAVYDAGYGHIASACSPLFDSGGQPVADLSMPGIRRALRQFFTHSSAGRWPIAQLNRAAKDMMSNLKREESAGIDIRTGDEIQELGGSWEVRDYIKRLPAVTAEKERIGAEVNAATRIQADMLPNIFPAFPDRGRRDPARRRWLCPDGHS